jgi:hypothetical protein
MKSRIVMAAVLMAGAFAASCGKPDSVKWEPYEESAVSMARTLGKPILIYATADW